MTLEFSRTATQAMIGGCPFAYKLRYIDEIVPRIPAGPLQLGTLGHFGLLEASKLEGEPVGVRSECAFLRMEHEQKKWCEHEAIAPYLSDEQRADGQERLDLAALLVERVLRDPQFDAWETIRTKDGTLCAEIDVDGVQVDRIARHKGSGHIVVWDWKFTKNLKREDYWDIDAQLPYYAAKIDAAGILDEPIASCVYAQIRTRAMDRPSLNKDGRMSRSKSIVTDWQTYRAALEDAGLDPNDYRDMEVYLSQVQHQSVCRYVLSAEQKQYFAKTFVRQHTIRTALHRVHEHVNVPGFIDPEFPRVADAFKCKTCEYRDYCLADLHGQDTEFLLQTTYARASELPQLRVLPESNE